MNEGSLCRSSCIVNTRTSETFSAKNYMQREKQWLQDLRTSMPSISVSVLISFRLDVPLNKPNLMSL